MGLATRTVSANVPNEDTTESTVRLWRARSHNTPATLLELVWIVSELTPDDDEVVATVVHMLRSGAVQLRTKTGERV